MNSLGGQLIVNLQDLTRLAIDHICRNVLPGRGQSTRSLPGVRPTDPVSPLLLGGVKCLIGGRYDLIGA